MQLPAVFDRWPDVGDSFSKPVEHLDIKGSIHSMSFRYKFVVDDSLLSKKTMSIAFI
jgi:hypothetical protein